MSTDQVAERITFGRGLGCDMSEWSTGPVVAKLLPEACFDLIHKTSRTGGVVSIPGESAGVTVRIDGDQLVACVDGINAELQVFSTGPWVLAAEVPEEWILILFERLRA